MINKEGKKQIAIEYVEVMDKIGEFTVENLINFLWIINVLPSDIEEPYVEVTEKYIMMNWSSYLDSWDPDIFICFYFTGGKIEVTVEKYEVTVIHVPADKPHLLRKNFELIVKYLKEIKYNIY